MSILLVSILVAALLLLLVLIPALGLQLCLRLIGPPPTRRPATPISASPARTFGLFRVAR